MDKEAIDAINDLTASVRELVTELRADRVKKAATEEQIRTVLDRITAASEPTAIGEIEPVRAVASSGRRSA